MTKNKGGNVGNHEPRGEGQGKGGTDGGTDPSSTGEFAAGSKDEPKAQTEEAKWKVALKQAAVVAKYQGRLPAGMERIITDFLDPKLSRKEIIRTLPTSTAKEDNPGPPPNRRYMGRGIILPSLHV